MPANVFLERLELTENKIIGKTYSPYGTNNSSDCFYEDLSKFTGLALKEIREESNLLGFIRKSSRRKRLLKKAAKISQKISLLKNILPGSDNTFSKDQSKKVFYASTNSEGGFIDIVNHFTMSIAEYFIGKSIPTEREHFEIAAK